MTEKIEIQARNMRMTDNVRDYVEKKAAKLERYLQEIEEIRVELSHIKSARSAQDRQVAQITVHGKGFILRSEERADDIHAAFDTALDKVQRQIDRYKGKHYRGRGDGRSAAEVVDEEELPVDLRHLLFEILHLSDFFWIKDTLDIACRSDKCR